MSTLKRSLLEAHALLKEKKISVQELTREAFSVAKLNEHNAYISLFEDLALAEAQKTDDLIARDGVKGPLMGIPYSLKDIFLTENLRTTAASKSLLNFISPYDGFVAKTLKEEGALLVGKNNLDEFAMGSTNENSAFGAVLNPLDKKTVAGGSSGGSAAAVAEGSSYFSIGSDTGGSIRLPANFCGLTSYKPTYGAVSRFGQIAFSSGLDQASPIARDVSDLHAVAQALLKKDPKDNTSIALPGGGLSSLEGASLKGKKIGIVKDYEGKVSPVVEEALKKAKEAAQKGGAEIVEVELPHAKYAVSVYYLMAPSEASGNLARYDGVHYGYRCQDAENIEELYKMSRANSFGPEVKKRIMLGTFALSVGYFDAFYQKAAKVRRLIQRDFQKAFSSCDFIMAPVCQNTAFEVGAKRETLDLYMNDLFTIPVNLAGHSAIAMPTEDFIHGKNKKATGIQLIASQFHDSELFKVSYALERELQGKGSKV